MIMKLCNYHYCKPLINRFSQFSSNRTHSLRIFSTFLLTLLLFSSLLRTSLYLGKYDDRQGFHGSFRGGRFLSTGAIFQVEEGQVLNGAELAFIGDDVLYCDRSHNRTDVCVAEGDVRVVGGVHHERTYNVLVYAGAGNEREEILKPYTRKWEDSVMQTIDAVKLIRKVQKRSSNGDLWTTAAAAPAADVPAPAQAKSVEDDDHTAIAASDKTSPICEVQHDVPAILFSTGGYTGNVYHEFNDGIIPLYITAQKYAPGQVVLLLLEFHSWWVSKYAEIVSQISNYTIIDLAHDKRVHCFPEVTVGLHIHGELAIDADHDQHLGSSNRIASMQGFQSMLHAAYLPRLHDDLITASSPLPPLQARPKLVIISRRSPRALLNEKEVIALAEEIGFSVHLLAPTPTTEMVDMYRELSRCDVMLGVHGAAMTHLLFMRSGATFIQVIPLGTDWAAETYYGEPAQKLGLRYMAYKVSPAESSLSQKYGSDDPVLVRPETVNDRGWEETKRVYLEGQDVHVSLTKMQAILSSAYTHHAAMERGR